MKVIIKNGTIEFKVFQKLFESGVVNNAYEESNTINTANKYKLWWFKNLTTMPQTYRLYNVVGNAYNNSSIFLGSTKILSVGDVKDVDYTILKRVVKGSPFDGTVTIEPGTFLTISSYAISSGVPMLELDGKSIELPAN